MSRLRLLSREEDFLSHYNGENPIKYNVYVCPNCGYAAYHSDFDSITKDKIPLITDNISSRWKKRTFGDTRDLDLSIEAYKLALINYGVIGKSDLETGNILLGIAWLYRLGENTDEEIRFIDLARDKFINAYNFENLINTNMDDSKLSYLIGELSRRIDKKEEALSWFNICINLPSTGANPKINSMAREQWRMARDIKK